MLKVSWSKKFELDQAKNFSKPSCVLSEISVSTFCKLKYQKADKQLSLIHVGRSWALPDLLNNLSLQSIVLKYTVKYNCLFR